MISSDKIGSRLRGCFDNNDDDAFHLFDIEGYFADSSYVTSERAKGLTK